MKLLFTVLALASLSSSSAFVPPRPQCVDQTKRFYENDTGPLPPKFGSNAPKNEVSYRDEVVAPQTSNDIESTEDEVITKEEVALLRSVVKSLTSIEDTKHLNDLAVNNRDLDIEEFEEVVTTKRARSFKPFDPLADSVAKQLLKANADKTEQKEGTESIFKRLSKLLDNADRLFDGDGMILEYEKYQDHPEFPDYDLSNLMPMLKGVPPLEYWFSLRKFRRLIKRVVLTTVGLSLTANNVNKAQPEDKFKAFFTSPKILGVFPNPLNLVPPPEYVLNHWQQDAEFSRQFLNGVNPLMIERVRNLEQQVTTELRSASAADVDLAQLVSEKRLFVVDYKWLADLKVNPHQAYPLPMNKDAPQDQPRYFQAPQVLLKLDDDRQNLRVLAVQLEQEPASPVYSPSLTDDTTWMFVKASVANCDSQFHEWASHLGKTHLTMEPHIVAIHNTLRRENHKLFTFLKPMVRDTLLLGYAARRTLASPSAESFGDEITSVGTGQFMQLINRYWQEYDFFKSSALPDELESRGFEADLDMPAYLYRLDGMKLWDAYGEFAADFIDTIYESDQSIKNDGVLQEWARETSDPKKAAVKGFPKSIEDKATLTKVLQTLWWICSGLHAAVNFPQNDYYSFQPNKPLGMRAGMTQLGENREDNPGVRDWIFDNAMPNMDAVKTAISTTTTLTLPSKHTIDTLGNHFKGTEGEIAYDKFLIRLKAIGDEINARNKKNRDTGKSVYHYLHPSVVPASIDI